MRILRHALILLLCLFFLSATAFAQKSDAQKKVELEQQARQIRNKILAGPPQFSLIGTVERGAKTRFAINGEDFVLDSNARVNGDLQVGSKARVRGIRLGKRNIAKKVIIGRRQVMARSTAAKHDRAPGEGLGEPAADAAIKER